MKYIFLRVNKSIHLANKECLIYSAYKTIMKQVMLYVIEFLVYIKFKEININD